MSEWSEPDDAGFFDDYGCDEDETADYEPDDFHDDEDLSSADIARLRRLDLWAE